MIVSGGMVEKDFALSILKSEETEFVIGVDRGLVFLYDNEIKPDYIVGDFDSVPRKLVEYYREDRHPGGNRQPDRSPVGKCAMFTNCAGSRSGRLHYGRSQ